MTDERPVRVEPPDTVNPRRPSWMVDGMTARLYEGTDPLAVVGESEAQDQLRMIIDEVGPDVVAILAPEPGHPFDPSAVAVWVSGWQVGYLASGTAATYAPSVRRLAVDVPVALRGRIIAGGLGGQGLRLQLSYDPKDFTA